MGADITIDGKGCSVHVRIYGTGSTNDVCVMEAGSQGNWEALYLV